MMIYQGYLSYGADTRLHPKSLREITQKLLKQEFSFLNATHGQYLFYITLKYRDTKGNYNYGADTKLHLKSSRGYNSESMKARVAILVRVTSSFHYITVKNHYYNIPKDI